MRIEKIIFQCGLIMEKNTKASGGWGFAKELEPIQNQRLFNRRLNRILHDENKLIFVYNNRIRKYSLEDGDLIENKAVRAAREMKVSGEVVCLED